MICRVGNGEITHNLSEEAAKQQRLLPYICRWQSHQNGHATPFKRKSKRFQLIVSHFIYKNCQVNFWFSLSSQKLSKSDLIVLYRPDKRHKGSIGKCKSKIERSVYEFSSRLTHLPCSLPSAIIYSFKAGILILRNRSMNRFELEILYV